MKSLIDHLKIIRRTAVIRDLKIMGWKIYALFLIVLFSAVLLESVFYFSPFIKYSIWLTGAAVSVLYFVWLAQRAYAVNQNRAEPYRWSTLALKAGAELFDKEDTLINALQLEREAGQNTSNALARSFVRKATEKLGELDLTTIFSNRILQRWKKTAFILLILTLLIPALTWRHSVSAVYRWVHPKTQFIPPLPLRIESMDGHRHLLGGEPVTINFRVKGLIPDSITVVLRSLAVIKTGDSLQYFKVPRSLNRTNKLNQGNYQLTLPEVFHDISYRAYVSSSHFWQPWNEISTPPFSISVTDRPTLELFKISIIPPAYSKLPLIVQKANQADVIALKGSSMAVSLTSSRSLSSAELVLNNESLAMKIRRKSA
ncbi:MAG: hypothetical protein V3S22_04205, partial [Candidatus Neomarinimicrobiota bacterium]